MTCVTILQVISINDNVINIYVSKINELYVIISIVKSFL